MTNPIRQAVDALKKGVAYSQCSDGCFECNCGVPHDPANTNVALTDAHTRLTKFAPLIEELLTPQLEAFRNNEHFTVGAHDEQLKALLDAGWDEGDL